LICLESTQKMGWWEATYSMFAVNIPVEKYEETHFLPCS
jgi:hypothetical protein